MLACVFFCIYDFFVTGALISFSLCGIGCYRPNVFCDCPGHTRFCAVLFIKVMLRLSRVYL